MGPLGGYLLNQLILHIEINKFHNKLAKKNKHSSYEEHLPTVHGANSASEGRNARGKNLFFKQLYLRNLVTEGPKMGLKLKILVKT